MLQIRYNLKNTKMDAFVSTFAKVLGRSYIYRNKVRASEDNTGTYLEVDNGDTTPTFGRIIHSEQHKFESITSLTCLVQYWRWS